jgi:hypothetical protein
LLARRPRGNVCAVDIVDDLTRAIFSDPSAGSRTLARLDAPRHALRELVVTRESLDRLEAALVREARSHGSTWAEIAADLGVSRPTAQRRHARREARAARPPSPPVAERPPRPGDPRPVRSPATRV